MTQRKLQLSEIQDKINLEFPLIFSKFDKSKTVWQILEPYGQFIFPQRFVH